MLAAQIECEFLKTKCVKSDCVQVRYTMDITHT